MSTRATDVYEATAAKGSGRSPAWWPTSEPTSTHAGDAELLERYASWRDEQAFTDIVKRHGRLVRRICFGVTRSHHDAEDLTQECFLKLALDAHRVTGNVRSWLCSVAKSRAIDHIRRAAVRSRHECRFGGAANRDEPATSGMADVLPLIWSVLETMPDTIGRFLVQHYAFGIPCAAIAATAGTTKGAVASRIRSGLDTLRRRLRRAGATA